MTHPNYDEIRDLTRDAHGANLTLGRAAGLVATGFSAVVLSLWVASHVFSLSMNDWPDVGRLNACTDAELHGAECMALAQGVR